MAVACNSKSDADTGSSLEFISLQEAERNFAGTLTAEDSLQVLMLGQQVIDRILRRHADSAFMLVVDPVTLQPLGSKRIQRLARLYDNEFESAQLEYCAFSLNGLNDLKYRLTTGGDNSAAVSIMFNPVKTGNVWLLGLKTESTPSKDQDKPLHPMTPIFVDK